MEAEPIHIFPFKADEYCPEFVNPCKGALNCKAVLVCIPIKVSLSATFDRFAIAFIFRNVRDNATIPQHLPSCLCVKAFICIEQGTFIVEMTAPHVGKQLLEGLCYVIGVVMVASHDLGCGDNIPIFIRQWENVARLGFLSPLIGDAFAPFLATVWLPSR